MVFACIFFRLLFPRIKQVLISEGRRGHFRGLQFLLRKAKDPFLRRINEEPCAQLLRWN
jgi:hypothetical protein